MTPASPFPFPSEALCPNIPGGGRKGNIGKDIGVCGLTPVPFCSWLMNGGSQGKGGIIDIRGVLLLARAVADDLPLKLEAPLSASETAPNVISSSGQSSCVRMCCIMLSVRLNDLKHRG